MKKILIISLFLFGQQAFAEVIPSDQLTGIYKNQGKTKTYKINEVESGLNFANSILCYLHSLRSEEFVNIGNYAVWRLDLTFSSFPLFILFEKNYTIFKKV
jgi:hypothetical protein